MRAKTKIKRAELALKVMIIRGDEPRTLNFWLDIINKELTSQYSFRSTKELAYMFRYMSKVMKINLIKTKELVSLKNCKICNTFYTLRNNND